MRILVFLVMDSVCPLTVMLMDATVLDETIGTCDSERHAYTSVLRQVGPSGAASLLATLVYGFLPTSVTTGEA